jgi:UDP-2,3-diacylglucosamine pyrophosphatase LpxH
MSGMKGLFVSDLHLFSQRSLGKQRWQQCTERICQADMVVLGGDIFDFRWSRAGNLRETLKAAGAWLNEAVQMNPTATWVYLLGNHDCHPEMQLLLDELSQQHACFSWNPFCWIAGDNLFLHGDILDARRHRGGLHGYRSAFHESEPRGRLSNLAYSALVQSRLHKLIPAVRRTRQNCCRQLIRCLENDPRADLTGIRNIYFGHTHHAMSGVRCGHYTVFNAGSGIRHMAFVPAEFVVRGQAESPG